MMRLLTAAALVVALNAAAFALDDAARMAVRDAIGRQIDAFRRDDAAGAYALAAPGIQRVLPTAEAFLDMVKRSYPPVYRPRSFIFGEESEASTGVEQAVNIQAEDGTDWVAHYSLAKQPDGAWRITGCVLTKAPGLSI